jgi:hypothetical protein
MITVKCNGCGGDFETPKRKPRRCCSKECMATVLRARNKARTTPISIVCGECGEAFDAPRTAKRLYCSAPCARAARARNISAAYAAKPPPEPLRQVCKECGETFECSRSAPRKLCSPECIATMRARVSSATIKQVHANPEYRRKRKEGARRQMKALWKDEGFRERASRASSERMKRRRNGGDPELNALLAKACGDHFRRLWQDPEFRAARAAASSEHIAAYNADEERRKPRDEKNRRIMQTASKRLKDDPAFLELMSVKLQEYRQQEPYRPAEHGDYTTNYCSMILSRVNRDDEVREFCDSRMSVYLKEAIADTRQS